MVSAEDPDWQLRILEVHAQLSAPSFGILLNIGMVMGSVSAGTFLGAVLSGNTNVVVVAILLVMTVAIFLVMMFYTISVSRRRDKFLRGLQQLARGQAIPNFAEFLRELEV